MNVLDAIKVVKKIKAKDADTSKAALDKVAKEINQKWGRKLGEKAYATDYKEICCYGVEAGSSLSKEIAKFIKSKGYRIMFDGQDDAGIYNIL